MLARKNRLITADEFRGVLRRGKRQVADSFTVSVVGTSIGAPARFGFVVTKKVGNAVNRNLVRRRLRAAARELVDGGLEGMDVVVRAHPSSATADWASLRDELQTSVSGGRP